MAAGKPNWMETKGARRPERMIYLAVGGAVLVVGVILAIFLLTSRRPGGAIPADAAAAVTDDDLAYLVLCPKLAQEFGFDRAGEIRLAILGRDAAGGIDAAAMGRAVRAFASGNQVGKLGMMLLEGRLKHINDSGGNLEFTPVGWDTWRGAETLAAYYTGEYILSLAQGVDDVLPLLAGESRFRSFAGTWLAETARLVESDRARVCQALDGSRKSAGDGDRANLLGALIRWAGPGQAELLANTFDSAGDDELRARIIARLGVIDPGVLQRVIGGLAGDSGRLSAVMELLAALPAGEGAVALDHLARGDDERVRAAAQAVARVVEARPPVVAPVPAGPATRPARPPVVAVSRPALVVCGPIDSSASAAEALKTGDAVRRREALRWMTSTPTLDEPKAALTAIEPLLATPNRNELREILAAYVKWAGPDQAAKLTAMATSGQDFGTAWPSLMVGLMKTAPATGRKIFEDRYDQVAFRMPTITELKRLESGHESAFWPLLDSPRWDVVKTTAEILGEVGTKTSIPTLEAIVAKAPQRNQAQVKRWVDGAIARINGRGK